MTTMRKTHKRIKNIPSHGGQHLASYNANVHPGRNTVATSWHTLVAYTNCPVLARVPNKAGIKSGVRGRHCRHTSLTWALAGSTLN